MGFAMAPCRFVVLMFGLLLAIPVVAVPVTTPAEQEQNRQRIQKLRKENKAYLAQLRQQAQAFLTLPPERANQLRQLDRDLYALPPAYRMHLQQVMKNYVTWLTRLSPEEREEIEQAPDADARLSRIGHLREQQWIATLPKVDRVRLGNLNEQERHKEIAKLKRQQFKWHVEWQLAMNHWEALQAPKFKKKSEHLFERLDDLPEGQLGVRSYVHDLLRHLAKPTRWNKLLAAEGHWPWFPYVLVKLADDYPAALPGDKPWPVRLEDLPPEIKSRLKDGDTNQLKALEGEWPAFAARVATLIDRKKPSEVRYDLWPTRRADLSPAVREFLDQELKDQLTPAEEGELQAAEGSWPAYPQAIRILARKYYLIVPWQSLPPVPPGDLWNTYRIKKSPGAISLAVP
jgi:hypothetical protein